LVAIIDNIELCGGKGLGEKPFDFARNSSAHDRIFPFMPNALA
jgi:hypothetical protein